MPTGIYTRTKKHREALSKAHKGICPSNKTKEKMSNSQKGNTNGLGKHWNVSKQGRKNMSKARKGISYSKETKRKMSESHLGEKNSNWKGGKSFEPYSIDWTETLRRSIRERDNYICQLCSQYGNIVHHTDYDKKNCNPKNLITLCIGCNSKVNFNRKYWILYFKNK